MMQGDDIVQEFCWMAKLPFWEKLNEEQREKLRTNTSEHIVEKGQILYHGKCDCMGVSFVRKGGLRVFLLSEDGREVTLYRLREGESCMLSASCVLESITFSVFIQAEEKTQFCRIQSKAFESVMEENIYLEAFCYKEIAKRFSDVMWTMQQILFMGIDKRLALFLLEQIRREGSMEIRMTQEQIAGYLGTAREVVSRMIKYFSEEGMVETFRGGVRILDIERLKGLCG
jgi:CRP/FNR family transcriptional regulator